MRFLRQFISILCIVGGIAIAGYAVWGLFELTSMEFGKYSAGARDTSTGILLALIGIALAVTGLSNFALAGKPSDQSADGSNRLPPDA